MDPNQPNNGNQSGDQQMPAGMPQQPSTPSGGGMGEPVPPTGGQQNPPTGGMGQPEPSPMGDAGVTGGMNEPSAPQGDAGNTNPAPEPTAPSMGDNPMGGGMPSTDAPAEGQTGTDQSGNQA